MVKISGRLRKPLESKFLTSCNLKTPFGSLHYYDSHPEGSDLAPLILLHGLGSNGQSFFLLSTFFFKKRRIIIPDLFQFSGRSKAKKSQGVLDISDHVRSIAILIDELKLSNIDVCGLSMGGWISILLALEYEQKIKTITLINPGGIGLKSGELAQLIKNLNRNNFKSVYESLVHNRLFRKTPIFSGLTKKVLFSGLNQKSVKDFVDSVKEEHLIDDKLAHIKQPTLLIWGIHDRFLPNSVPFLLMKSVPDIEGYFLLTSAHIPTIESPLTVYLLMKRFLGIMPKSSHILFSEFSDKILKPRNVQPIRMGGMSFEDVKTS